LGEQRSGTILNTIMTDPNDVPLSDFLTELLREGRARVRGNLHLTPPSPTDIHHAEQLLTEMEAAAVADAPGTAPELNLAAVLWAGEAFAWACGMLIDRSQTDVGIPARIAQRTPNPTDPRNHWSVDLVFRFAGDLVRRCEKIGKDDPLYEELVKLLSPWPLASVGTSIENPLEALGVVMSNDCLRTILIDRIIIRRDTVRAEMQPLARSIQHVVGAHPHLGIKTS
jgi:hypothetical protein